MEPPLIGEKYVVGCDLGKAEDFTVVCVIRRSSRALVHIKRFKGLNWESQVAEVVAVSRHYYDAPVWLDRSGLGDPISDRLFALGVPVRGYIFTSESKRRLLENLSKAITEHAIRFPHIPDLVEELEVFTAGPLPGGGVGYAAPAGYHDDAVVALGLAVWGLDQDATTGYPRLEAEVAFAAGSPWGPGLDEDEQRDSRRDNFPTPAQPKSGDEVREVIYDRLVEVWRKQKRHCVLNEDDFDTPPLRGFSWDARVAALKGLTDADEAIACEVFCGPWRGDIRRETEEYAREAVVAFVKKQKTTDENELRYHLKLALPVIENAVKSLLAEVPPRIVKEAGVIRPAGKEI